MNGRRTALSVGIVLVLVILVLTWIRGSQPELREPEAAHHAVAQSLLEAVARYLDGEEPGPLPDLAGDTWYVSAYKNGKRYPVTVQAEDGELDSWASALRKGWPGRLQVDRAFLPAPAARLWLGGLGLDVVYDGWIEEDGKVHLPVEFVLEGKSRRELKNYIEEHPGGPLRTVAWIHDGSGAQRMVRHSIDPGEITPKLLRQRCDLGGDYLAAHVGRRDKYDYAWRARTGSKGKGYNLLRHAGTTYSLFQLYNHTGQENHYEAGQKALKWLKRQRRFGHDDPTRCFEVRGEKVKLGGAGLTLLALVEQAKAKPDEADWEWMHCLANHIVAETDEQGYMASFFTDGDIYKWSDHRSIYYPGEALLGLVRLYEIDPDPRWQECAVRGTDFLVHERWHALGLELQVPPDCWLIQSLEVLHRQVPDPAYAEYAFRIGRKLTGPQLVSDRVPADLLGGRVSGSLPHVVSTGSRGEGMSAAAKLERRVRPGENFYLERLRLNSHYALRNQYTEPILFGLARPETSLGGFRDSPIKPEVRIDGVQHNLSGLLGLLDLLEETP